MQHAQDAQSKQQTLAMAANQSFQTGLTEQLQAVIQQQKA
jgi:hypothetical protein